MPRPPPPPWHYAVDLSRGSSGGYGRPPGYFTQNINYQFPSNLQYAQQPPRIPQPMFQKPTRVVKPQAPPIRNPSFPSPKASQSPPVTLERVEAAASKAHRDLAVAGEHLTAWNVCQSVLVELKVDSWASLGFQLQDVPTLRRLLLTEGKVNTFIHCFVCARKITSMYELEAAICKNGRVNQFEELGMGPFLRYPLVKHYFSVPSELTEVFKISSEDIIISLQSFMDKHKKVSAEDFLVFLAKEKSVSIKENLGVRIQNIGYYVHHIREVLRTENTGIRLRTENTGIREKLNKVKAVRDKIKMMERKGIKRFSSEEKQELDDRFNHLSSCFKSLASNFSDSGGNHIYFISSDEDNATLEDDDNDDEEDNKSINKHQSASHDMGGFQHANSCPYPSKAEEMTRLGLKAENCYEAGIGLAADRENRKLSRRKRKRENRSNTFLSRKCQKRMESFDLDAEQLLGNLTLSNGDMEKFVTTWKDACREHSVTEVLDMMLHFYVKANKKRRKINNLLSSYPFIGMLNVAVLSIKKGMLGSLYDTFQALSGKELMGRNSAGFAETIDVGPEVEDSITIIPKEFGYSVSMDDIIKKIKTYFENVQIASIRGLPSLKLLAFLKLLHNCEVWLMAEFNVQEFRSLGHGNFYDFLDRHISILPHEVHSFFNKELFRSSCFEVCISDQQLRIMLSQAEANLMAKGDTCDYIFSLLRKQFPIACFHIVGEDLKKHIGDLINKNIENGNSSSILFSTCLLEEKWHRNLLSCKENSLTENEWTIMGIPQQTFRRSSKEATECLLKAPMLSDLQYWSHWDLIYAPSLGPLSDWLVNKFNSKELLCIATVHGKFIRIDHSATVDDFLEALVQCSAFHVALKLLSLLCIHRGTSNAPLALLKCYAKKAVDVIIRNSTDSVPINLGESGSMPGHIGLSTGLTSSPAPVKVVDKCNESSQGSVFHTGLCTVDKVISVVSRTTLECLHYLPSEFRNVAAEILLSGLWPITKQAPAVILNECIQTDERMMLHDIGLSLGVTEWVMDYHEFSSLAAVEPRRSEALEKHSLGALTDISQVQKNCQSSSGVDMQGNGTSNSRFFRKISENVEIHTHCKENGIDDIISEEQTLQDSTAIIESIRRDEFGLDSNSNQTTNHLLRKQHARLGRALHCLSQELYSQDSHFILELVQNADDNIYPDNVEPELVFILHETGIVVLNNEHGFSAENIRALCDIGNSTKKGSAGGYIGKKGIGFKSVFRVTDAPEIHSNGFHVKFDITEGQIGFVLPTVVPPWDLSIFKPILSGEDYQGDGSNWKTCILLPFRPKSKGGVAISSIISMFSDLHPSLLLFLHRLQCIRFKNVLNDKVIVMRKETHDDGIVKVYHGEEVTTWLVVSKKLKCSVIRTDVEGTKISVAFTLLESVGGEYKPCLHYQPVFAFLPLRNYGLKFILQGDFVLPSSREEVDGDSAWNQWLLSEFPSLFVSAEQFFCTLPCFQKSAGKAVTIYLSFVPLVGEVHGFFSHLPHMIISLLRLSKCLLQESPDLTWVLPCRALRGWNEQVRLLLSDHLLQKHTGLVYLHKDVKLSDALSVALGIQDYGPKVLVEVMSSVCHSIEDMKSLGVDWFAAWFAVLFSTLSLHSSGCSSPNAEIEYDILNTLRHMPIIPLSDGSYGSISGGPIWLPCGMLNLGSKGEYCPEDFPCIYNKLKMVNPHIFSIAKGNSYSKEEIKADIVMQMLLKIGVQQLSAHEVIRSHVLVSLTENHAAEDRELMVEYLSFIMLHSQFDCARCHSDRAEIMLELQKNHVLITNHGYSCPLNEPVHFGREYGNPFDIAMLLDEVDINWVEIDPCYLKHPVTQLLPSGLMKWRSFLRDLGVTDFVKVTCNEKNVGVISDAPMGNNSVNLTSSYVRDWESPELVNLLSIFSSNGHRTKSMHLLEILDKLWDDLYHSQTISFIISKSDGTKKPIVSSFMKSIQEFPWIPSTLDKELHQPKSIFYDCEQVCSILGTMGPYATPQVNSELLVKDIGFKVEVSIDDAMEILQRWIMSSSPFVACTAQMLRFYTFISNGIVSSSLKVTQDLISSRFIFVPFFSSCKNIDPGSGMFVSPKEAYWQDPTGCVDRMNELIKLCIPVEDRDYILCPALGNVYPGLHDFFVNVCAVPVTPPFCSYFQILQQLSAVALPSQAAHEVFRVMLKWAAEMKSGLVSSDQIAELKEKLLKLENTVLPTEQDKWVSLHPSFGLLSWSDDDELKQQFKHSDGVNLIMFGDLSMEEKALLSGEVATFLRRLSVYPLSEVVSREAIFYGTEENPEKVALLNWIIPYAQRYLHQLHTDMYLELKQLGFEKILQLQLVIVGKLFYKLTLQGHDSSSKRRIECNCLLQGNILYATHNTDTHSMYLELSRFFFNGSSELHFANFLHMVTTMADSGSTDEQIEYFVVNGQKIPKLPDDEPAWSIHTIDDHKVSNSDLVLSTRLDDDSSSKAPLCKAGSGTSWPPTSWKNAPDFHFSRTRNLRTTPWTQPDLNRVTECETTPMEEPVPVEITGNWSSEALEYKCILEPSGDASGQRTGPTIPPKLPPRERINWQVPNEHQLRMTGKLGEMIAFRYFLEKLGPRCVRWVNEETETGLPYDLLVGEEENVEFVEVKATSSASKDWFEITSREWNFAVEKGESYSIAHVVILGTDKATVTVLRNPLKLCHQKALTLALLMSRRVKD